MAGKNVLEFTSENWQKEVEQSEVPVVVDFWAPWCGPCRLLGPIMDRLSEQFAGKAKVGKLNIDDAGDIAVKYGIASIPRVFIFKGGEKPLTTFNYGPREQELVSAIEKAIAS